MHTFSKTSVFTIKNNHSCSAGCSRPAPGATRLPTGMPHSVRNPLALEGFSWQSLWCIRNRYGLLAESCGARRHKIPTGMPRSVRNPGRNLWCWRVLSWQKLDIPAGVPTGMPRSVRNPEVLGTTGFRQKSKVFVDSFAFLIRDAGAMPCIKNSVASLGSVTYYTYFREPSETFAGTLLPERFCRERFWRNAFAGTLLPGTLLRTRTLIYIYILY